MYHADPRPIKPAKNLTDHNFQFMHCIDGLYIQMPRVTISIPTDLRGQLHDPRVRNSLNISRVCQDALRREVRRLLDLPLAVEQVEQILERLRQERNRLGERWFADGVRTARDWVEHEAAYAELRALGGLAPKARLDRLRHTPPPALHALLSARACEPGFDREGFLEGWSRTIGPLWELLQPHL